MIIIIIIISYDYFMIVLPVVKDARADALPLRHGLHDPVCV